MAAVVLGAVFLSSCAAPGPTSGNQTAEVLLDQLVTDLHGVTGQLGGPWTREGEPFDPAMDRTDLNPAPCRSGDQAGTDALEGPLQFQLVLEGEGHADPEATLDQVSQWAQGEGYRDVRRGEGPMPQDADRFITLDRADGTLLTVDVSTQRSQVGGYTACSEHSSLQEYTKEDYTSPGNRFETGSATPSAEETRRGG